MAADTERATVLALLGAGLLFFGSFSPVFSVPVFGQRTFIQNGQAQGFILIALAVLTVWLGLTKRYRALWWPGLIALAVIAYSYFSFRSELSGVSADIPFRELREAAMGSIQLQWGWAVLVIAGLLICGAAAISRA
jgi:hypothetical protein